MKACPDFFGESQIKQLLISNLTTLRHILQPPIYQVVTKKKPLVLSIFSKLMFIFNYVSNSRLQYLIIVGCMLLACNESKEKPPKYLLAEDKMAAVMLDMQLIESAGNLKLISADSATIRYREMFASIFVTHQITKADFDSSLFYYATKTDQMPLIYDKVLEELYELESEVNAANEHHMD